MRIHFIRHGETIKNKKGLIQGQIDSPLTELGKAQAIDSISKLKDLNLDIIYCSDLGRAKATADIINKEFNLDIIYDKRLRERHFGFYQNKSIKQFDFHEFFSGNIDRDEFSSVEKDAQIRGRLLDFLADLGKTSYDEVLVVTHGGMLVQVKLLHNKNWKYEKIDNCEVFSLDLKEITGA